MRLSILQLHRQLAHCLLQLRVESPSGGGGATAAAGNANRSLESGKPVQRRHYPSIQRHLSACDPSPAAYCSPSLGVLRLQHHFPRTRFSNKSYSTQLPQKSPCGTISPPESAKLVYRTAHTAPYKYYPDAGLGGSSPVAQRLGEEPSMKSIVPPFSKISDQVTQLFVHTSPFTLRLCT
jgi:hypothetical protein